MNFDPKLAILTRTWKNFSLFQSLKMSFSIMEMRWQYLIQSAGVRMVNFGLKSVL